MSRNCDFEAFRFSQRQKSGKVFGSKCKITVTPKTLRESAFSSYEAEARYRMFIFFFTLSCWKV